MKKMEDQLKSQLNIIATLQKNLLESITSGDWSGTDLWNKNLETSVNTFVTLQKENNMALKDQIDTLVAAVRDGRTQIAARDQTIADRDKTIAALNQNLATLKEDDDANRAKAATVVEAEAAATQAISDLGLNPSTSVPSAPAPTPPITSTPAPEVPAIVPPVATIPVPDASVPASPEAPIPTPSAPVGTTPVASIPAPTPTPVDAAPATTVGEPPVAVAPVSSAPTTTEGTPPLTQQLSTNP